MKNNKNCSVTEAILHQFLPDQDTIFVFPTNFAATLWMERVLEKVPAVSTERFIAWDLFKGSAIRSQQQNKQSIPSVLRKLFASNLIELNKNMVALNSPLLTSLITTEYAAEVSSFTNWIASLLPSLASWKKSFEKEINQQDFSEDGIDKDLLVLYEKYKEFLDANNLFDPAWETPPFKDTGFKYVVFYPEILTDYCEYKEILESAEQVKIVSLEQDDKIVSQTECTMYSNSRTELREMAVFIRDLVQQKKCKYTDIIISVPDMDNWGPYIMRELELFCIPAVLRTGKGLGYFGAGKFFSQVQQCVQQNFSFDSIKELLLNRQLPWKDKEAVELLIQYGIDNCCLCSYSDNDEMVDIWEKSFSVDSKSYREASLYEEIKKHCNALCKANSFKNIQSAYFQFKQALFDETKFSVESDSILGRCISELATLVDIEDNYSLETKNCYDFFISTVLEKEYVPQEEMVGVSVVPYKLAATAPAYCHIIPGGSQRDLSALFKQLGFLSPAKRQALNLLDVDFSSAFIELYRVHSYGTVRFTCSEKTFTGYSVPHSALNVTEDKNGRPESLEQCHSEDLFVQELLSLKQYGEPFLLKQITQWQKNGFIQWSKIAKNLNSNEKSIQDFTDSKEEIQKRVYDSKKVKVSQSALNDYFRCPRMWFFKRVLKLQEPSTEAQLMQDALEGTIYHDIINIYLRRYKTSKRPLDPPELNSQGQLQLSEENREFLKTTVCQVIKKYSASFLTKKLLAVQSKAFYTVLNSFLVYFTDWMKNYIVVSLEEELFFEKQTKNGNICLLHGRLDCVLSSQDDQDIILDFKTNSLPSKVSCLPDEKGVINNFQMPMYVSLWENHTGHGPVSKAAFVSIQKKEFVPIIGDFSNTKKGLNRESSDGFDAVLEAFENRLDEYVTAMETANFEYLTQVSYRTCQFCPWKTLCRSTYTVSGEKL